jgi:hypothetical protein
MNIHLALISAIRRFAERRASPRVVEKRTYVFILVPFNFCGNGHAKKSELEQDLIDNGSRRRRMDWRPFFYARCS